MVEIYRKSLRFYWQSLPMLLLFSAIIEGMTLLLQPTHGAAISLVPLTIIAYMFHRYFLFGEQFTIASSSGKAQSGSPPMKFGWFILLSLGLIILPTAMAMVVVIKVVPDATGHGRLAYYLLLIMLPIYLVILSAFGPVLPALVERNRAYRISTGVRATFQTMWRLLLGPALIGAVVFVATILLSNWLEPNPVYQSSTGQFVFAVLSSTAGFLPTLLAVGVLCHVYQKIKPVTAPAAGF